MQDSTNYGKYVEKGKILTIGGSNFRTMQKSVTLLSDLYMQRFSYNRENSKLQ
jgi:hypothetical protein